jgi:ribonuclease VapC
LGERGSWACRTLSSLTLRYGKGRHAAGLNFGDCMAYAVAQAEGAPLLFTGDDFAKTDVARWDG